MSEKRNVLCICNTYRQLLVAIQLKRTRFIDDQVQIILTDHSKGTNSIAEKLRLEKNLFSDVFYAETKAIDYRKHTLLTRLTMAFRCIFGFYSKIGCVKKLKKVDVLCYYNNNTYFAKIVYARLVYSNPDLLCAKFDEGILSYNFDFAADTASKFDKFVRLGLHCRRHKTLEEQTSTFYCFFPEMYDGNLNAVVLQPLNADDESLSDLFKRIFSIRSETLCYKQRYIYFASHVDSDMGINVEFNVVEKLANILGKENILVKKHPRDFTTEYEDNGYCVDSNSTVPWEALQLCIDISDKVLISSLSGSVMSTNAMIENGVETWLLYKLYDDTIPAVKQSRTAMKIIVDKLKAAGNGNKICVMESLKEIDRSFKKKEEKI